MKPYAIKNVVSCLLLLAAMAILAAGCYWEGSSPGYYGDRYYGDRYYGDGYYGAPDRGYYRGDVIIEQHRRQGGERHEVYHMPARRLPEPAPRSRSAPDHRQKSDQRSEPRGR